MNWLVVALLWLIATERLEGPEAARELYQGFRLIALSFVIVITIIIVLAGIGAILGPNGGDCLIPKISVCPEQDFPGLFGRN